MRIKDLSYDDRPREKMISKGPSALSNAELLAILIRTGDSFRNAVELSQEIMSVIGGSVSALASTSLESLCDIPGIGTGKAVTIAAAIELGRRFCADNGNTEKTPVNSAEMVYRIMMPHLKGLDHEECWVLYLNRANYVIGKEALSSGGISSTTMDTKVLVRKALEKKASSIILVHNHPSGSPRPGADDIRVTRTLRRAVEPFDISLMDHVIFTDDRYFSFSDEKVTIVKNNA
ncbi:MAG: DNA repair protein RadC [Bacteroidales bacterium]|nr:DNA repair protein RadC [Bacteroidales bacterium]